MKNLPIDLEIFPFYEREKVNDRTVKNRCGRDFLFYALAFYFPTKFGLNKLTAYDLEHQGHFGISVPSYLSWMQIQFLRVPKYFKKLGLRLIINDRKINSFFDFVRANLFSRTTYEKAILDIEKIIDRNEVAGVDISIGYGGLLDHVLFVYGYDAESLCVFDTIRAPVQYESVDGKNMNMMKISKNEIKERWTHFGRVWNVTKVV
ncbi:MAG: hypothetical protein UU82_C0040G0004 [Candidatus Nomurabacteria bacterium GW2011_GWC2_41_8]|uniref:Peptidase C39-like domain-containing protein n=2 Tax=Candidatus Nomuraibacteriota TaxID=1752729 RepID=A0A1F6YAZ9_9BACT|nr:MAG: hypothetical protein UU82_C0040G0004 [Candidatus Nomurabacteria bacterium GW2011_GWC2_41_8]OGI80049.1 MAG: hypothetical protein A3D43_01435 [Candidatus Nomurabacteria bacterium RIFCSPHIGHO2_02_FULL_41_52]OGI85307.1 MAG: hypothetical protein A3F49_01235 [Candidatus Nomurabacteria bacterium RIFCSPHIGHO2_12_FULL_42_19]OGI94140.1 MAG: hypothetical protein A3A07_00885 [Candidatus Nomurabacteria bacterium RIFCSPLOWO2_01_FULL_41_52]OGI98962.1 MAG: hypothetical protein A3H56_00345 [Candidatus N